MNDLEMASAAISLEAAGDVEAAMSAVRPALLDPGQGGRVAAMAFDGGAYKVAEALVANLRPRSADLLVLILSALFAGLNGDAATAAREVDTIRASVSQVPRESAENVFLVLEPLFANAVSMRHGAVYADAHYGLVKALSPALRALFEAAVCGSGVPAFMPIVMHPPRRVAERQQRSMIIAVPDLFYPSAPTSRKFDIGPRVCGAAASYGWSPVFLPISGLDALQDWRRIEAAVTTAGHVDVLVAGESLFLDPTAAAHLSAIRSGGTKVVAMAYDPWVENTADCLHALAQELDLIWGPFPTVPAWKNPAFAGKLCFSPFPWGVAFPGPAQNLPASMTFIGDVQPANWTRMPWLTAIRHANIPLTYQAGQTDGDSMVGYRDYLERLGAGGIALNLSLRKGGSRPVTGRSFEAPLAGALLVQEEATDMPYFFAAGVHYLPFRSLADLRQVWEFVVDDPEGAKAIRQAGYDYAQARYGDEAILGDIDARLFTLGQA